MHKTTNRELGICSTDILDCNNVNTLNEWHDSINNQILKASGKIDAMLNNNPAPPDDDVRRTEAFILSCNMLKELINARREVLLKIDSFESIMLDVLHENIEPRLWMDCERIATERYNEQR